MINPYIVMSIGVVFGILELLSFDFVLIFFGIGFLITGLLGLVVDIPTWFQLLLSLSLALAGIFIFRKRLKVKLFKDSKPHKDNFLDNPGIGVVKGGLVLYGGTLWQCKELDELGYKDGDKVEVIGATNMGIVLKKPQKQEQNETVDQEAI